MERDQDQVKFWLSPVRLAWSRGFSAPEVRKIEGIVKENGDLLLESWNGFFSS